MNSFKKVLLILICIGFSWRGFSQNAYYDAIELSKSSKFIGTKLQIKVKFDPENDYLRKYSSKIQLAKIESIDALIENETDQAKITRLKQDLSLEYSRIFDDNPFIASFSATQQDAGDVTESILGGNLGNIGSLNVTNIADGLAKFLVKRAKQELSIAFFEKFQEQLEDQEQLRLMFPTTHKNLQSIGKEIYNFSAFIDLLRNGFQKDLANLLPNLQRLIDDDSMNDIFDNNPTLRTILADGIFLATELKNGNHIGDALNAYIDDQAEFEKLEVISPELYPSFATLNILSQSLRSNGDEYWIDREALKTLTDDKVAITIYLGLVYQRVKNFEEEQKVSVKFGDKELTQLMKDLFSTYDDIKSNLIPHLKEIISKGKDVSIKYKAVKQLQDHAEKEPGYQEFYELLNASLNFIDQIKKVHQIFDEKDTDVFDKYLAAARSLGNVYVDINQKQYLAAISELGYVLDEVLINKLDASTEFYQSIKQIEKSKNDLVKARKKLEGFEDKFNVELSLAGLRETSFSDLVNAENFKKLLAEADGIIDNNKEVYGKYAPIIANFKKYGNFIALIAKAENSDEVEAAIEAVALPAGSASIKKKSLFNISLNAYLGGFVGNEHLDNEKAIDDKALNYGFYAPVGVAGSVGLNKWGSLSLFISIIDVGAISSLHIQDTTGPENETPIEESTDPTTMMTTTTTETIMVMNEVEPLPEITLQNILAPGLHIVYGIPGAPVSIGTGYQRGPQLRKINRIEESTTETIVTDMDGTAQSTITSPTIRTESVLESSVWRWHFFIAVDIPLINFYNRSRKTISN